MPDEKERIHLLKEMNRLKDKQIETLEHSIMFHEKYPRDEELTKLHFEKNEQNTLIDIKDKMITEQADLVQAIVNRFNEYKKSHFTKVDWVAIEELQLEITILKRKAELQDDLIMTQDALLRSRGELVENTLDLYMKLKNEKSKMD